jgi:nucleoside-diphosphate-sugar epimerase
MEKNAKIYVAGHHGLVGSAIWKNLQNKGYTNLVGRTHKELDLLDSVSVRQFFDEEQPEYVFLAAAFVGGKQYLPRRLYLQKSANPTECHRGKFPPQHKKATLSRQYLYLST